MSATPRRYFDPEAVSDWDAGRFLRTLASSWWVIVGGAVFGAIVGYGIALGSSQVYRATANLYLGLPYSSAGDVALQSLQTNPTTINRIVHSRAIDLQVALRCRTPLSSFANGISTEQTLGSVLHNNQTPYTTLKVLARRRTVDACAANALAAETVRLLSPFADSKISALRAHIADDDRQIRQLQPQLAQSPGGATNGFALLVQLRGLQLDRTTMTQLLQQATEVEKPRILERARAVKVTGRSRRASTFVAALIGALLGCALIVLWDKVRRRAS